MGPMSSATAGAAVTATRLAMASSATHEGSVAAFCALSSRARPVAERWALPWEPEAGAVAEVSGWALLTHLGRILS